jgi:hypothetical protein
LGRATHTDPAGIQTPCTEEDDEMKIEIDDDVIETIAVLLINRDNEYLPGAEERVVPKPLLPELEAEISSVIAYVINKMNYNECVR